MASAQTGAEKRQQIVDTAYALFKREGFHATGIDRVIAESNVARMTMYRNFPSKEDLIVEVLRHRMRRFESQIDQLAERTATPEEKIGTILDWYARWYRNDDFHGCVFAHALAEYGEAGHPVFDVVAEQKLGFQRRLCGILAAAMPADRAESNAGVIAMLLEGATLLAQMGKGESAIRDARNAVARILQ
jgi:AcrR family transcriptional regulator